MLRHFAEFYMFPLGRAPFFLSLCLLSFGQTFLPAAPSVLPVLRSRFSRFNLLALPSRSLSRASFLSVQFFQPVLFDSRCLLPARPFDRHS